MSEKEKKMVAKELAPVDGMTPEELEKVALYDQRVRALKKDNRQRPTLLPSKGRARKFFWVDLAAIAFVGLVVGVALYGVLDATFDISVSPSVIIGAVLCTALGYYLKSATKSTKHTIQQDLKVLEECDPEGHRLHQRYQELSSSRPLTPDEKVLLKIERQGVTTEDLKDGVRANALSSMESRQL